MNIQDLLIRYEDAKALEHQLSECVICGKHEEQIWNDRYYRLPTCMEEECKKIWKILGCDIQNHCRQYFKALSNRLEYPSISEMQEYSISLLFKNLSIRLLNGRTTNISTHPQKYQTRKEDHLIVSNSEYKEWLELELKTTNEPYIREASEYNESDVLITSLVNEYYPPINIIDKIRERSEEYRLKKKITGKINQIERSIIGYCKPIKFKIKTIKTNEKR